MWTAVLSLFVLAYLTSCSGANPYFWHITDFHLDPTYATSQRSCNVDRSAPGKYGDYECDAPYELVRSSIKAMTEHGDQPKFILYTGDSILHPKSYDGFSTSYVLNMIQNITDVFNEFFPDTQFVVALGNHDYYRKDQLPGGPNEIYNATAEMWRTWFNNSETIAETFNKGAYYTMMLDPALNVRVVVTNTNLYLKANKATEGEEDPADHYAWLRDVLTAARTNNEKVHLVTHIPPGVMNVPGAPRWFREADNTKFNQIVREFSDVIIGYYSCHEHLDTFRLYYKDDVPVSVMLVAPAVTPWRARIGNNIRAEAHNPAVRKIVLDSTDGRLLDIEQYYLDLPAANADSTSDATWKKLYSFKDLYGVQKITATELHGLLQRMKVEDSVEFSNFYEMNTVKTNHSSIRPCDTACKHLHMCSIEHIDYASFDECNDPSDPSTSPRPNSGSSLAVSVILFFALLVAIF